MKIACLGWGSLIWRPDTLKIQNKWFDDGPLLPIEFTRISRNGRVTLIIDKESRAVRTLWSLMTVDNLDGAINSLKEREGIKKVELIHFVKSDDIIEDEIMSHVRDWIKSKNLTAAIWTGLSYSKETNNKRPDISFIIDYLKALDYNKRKIVEEYIRKAPRQIDTIYRRKIEQEFGWKSIE